MVLSRPTPVTTTVPVQAASMDTHDVYVVRNVTINTDPNDNTVSSLEVTEVALYQQERTGVILQPNRLNYS